jgi:hypothetical protein
MGKSQAASVNSAATRGSKDVFEAETVESGRIDHELGQETLGRGPGLELGLSTPGPAQGPFSRFASVELHPEGETAGEQSATGGGIVTERRKLQAQLLGVGLEEGAQQTGPEPGRQTTPAGRLGKSAGRATSPHHSFLVHHHLTSPRGGETEGVETDDVLGTDGGEANPSSRHRFHQGVTHGKSEIPRKRSFVVETGNLQTDGSVLFGGGDKARGQKLEDDVARTTFDLAQRGGAGIPVGDTGGAGARRGTAAPATSFTLVFAFTTRASTTGSLRDLRRGRNRTMSLRPTRGLQVLQQVVVGRSVRNPGITVGVARPGGRGAQARYQ